MTSFSASNSGAFTVNYTNDKTFYFLGQALFTDVWTSIVNGYTPGALGPFTSDWTIGGTGGSGKILSITFYIGDYDNKSVDIILKAGGGTFISGAGNTFYPPAVACFVEGTPILTQNGYKSIETLMSDDLVVTSDNRMIGFKLLKKPILSTTTLTAPYLVKPGAFGKNIPAVPISLSATHKIQIRKGVWISPERASETNPLVKQYGIGEPVVYYHIECENFLKDNIIAGGAIVESYGSARAIKGLDVIYRWSTRMEGYTRVSICALTKNK